MTHDKGALPLGALNRVVWPLKEISMHALKDLFTSDVGLMSLAVIAVGLGIGVYLILYALKHMREEEAAARRRS